jgi:hypothetical protein
LNDHFFISFFKGAFLGGIRDTSKYGKGVGGCIGIFPTGKPTTNGHRANNLRCSDIAYSNGRQYLMIPKQKIH